MTNTLLSTPMLLSSSSRSVDDNDCNDSLLSELTNDVLVSASTSTGKRISSSAACNSKNMKLKVGIATKTKVSPKTKIVGTVQMTKAGGITKHHGSLSSSSSSRRSVSRRVTNENMNHSVPQQSHEPKLPHDYTVLESSYVPNEYDVVLNYVNGTFQSNDTYDQYINTMSLSYMQSIHDGRYDLQFSAIQGIIESATKNGGKFLRSTTSSLGECCWIHVSPTIARMYTLYRLKYAMSLFNVSGDMKENRTRTTDRCETEMMTEHMEKNMDDYEPRDVHYDHSNIMSIAVVEHDYDDYGTSSCSSRCTNPNDLMKLLLQAAVSLSSLSSV